MKKHSNLIQILCFTLFIAVFFVLLIVMPRRDFSETENRVLTQAPKLTVSAYFDGSFGTAFEKFVTDQFPFRDAWVSLKAKAERYSGKTENNDVFLCSDDTLINRFQEPDEAKLSDAAEAIRKLSENTDARICLALIPSSAAVWADRLPAHANTADQKALIDQLYASCGVDTVDVFSALTEHAEESIFYRTDHHWTTLGAYYSYAAIARALGLTPAALESFTPETVSDSFCGTIYSSSGVRWLPPDSIQRYVPADGVTVTKYEGSDVIDCPVYDESKLQVKDKYAYFFGGNTPRMIIRTDADSANGKLLLIRDSYSDCELPFFFAHYSEIHVIDLRYFRQSLSEYCSENDFDTILIHYGLSNFVTDSSVFLLGC